MYDTEKSLDIANIYVITGIISLSTSSPLIRKLCTAMHMVFEERD